MRCARPTARSASRIAVVVGLLHQRRIGDRLAQRAERKVGALRQREHLRVLGEMDRALAERPQAGQRAEEARLAGAGRAADQQPLAGRELELVERGHRLAGRQPQHQIVDLQPAVAGQHRR